MLLRVRFRYILLAALLGLSSVTVFIAYLWARPTVLTIAVGNLQSDENQRLVTSFAQYLARNKENIRLKIQGSDTSEISAKMLGDGKVDLAIVRSDHALPATGHTVAIWQRNAVILITPAHLPITSVTGLVNRRVGIVRAQTPANRKLLNLLLNQYEIPVNAVQTPEVASGDVRKAFEDNLIDAVMVVGPPAGTLVTQVVSAVTEAGKGTPHFLAITEADAIVQRMPALETIEIVRGTYGGTSPRPAENLATFGASHRLLARDTLDEATVAEFTRLLFTARPSLAGAASIANRIEIPDTEKGAAVPVHVGAAAYLDGEEKTFFERYGDWFYVAIMAFSLLGSGVAALLSRSSAKNQRTISVLIERLLNLMRSARIVQDQARLDDLEHDVDLIVIQALNHTSNIGVESHMLDAFNLALTQARHVISERRKVLSLYPL